MTSRTAQGYDLTRNNTAGVGKNSIHAVQNWVQARSDPVQGKQDTDAVMARSWRGQQDHFFAWVTRSMVRSCPDPPGRAELCPGGAELGPGGAEFRPDGAELENTSRNLTANPKT